LKKLIIIVIVLLPVVAGAQESGKADETTEQQLEDMAEVNNAEPEDDSFLQQLAWYKKHPLNINAAGAEELAALNILSGLQIAAFLSYRKLLGNLISQYELQSIPSWDIATIKKILPFIEIKDDKNLAEQLKARWMGGDGISIARYARVLEKSKGYDKPAAPGANYYLGSRDKFFLRYSYNYKNLLQWGLLADKDAGEQFFKGSQRQGFDFYSFHFFAGKLGFVKAIALGDFTVNFGQGLIQWQTLAFKKNADVLAIKRQSPTLRPYNAAGEYNFHRGAGITMQKGNWETSLFASFRKISANINSDSVIDDGVVSSFLISGYHRTAAENADRNSLGQRAGGLNVKYLGSNWHAGINAIHYSFSRPVQKSGDPYNLFALQGASLTNTSIDYSYTCRNIHFFGEAAADSRFNTAFLNGVLVSVDANADFSIVYRRIKKNYQSVNANAFTENTFPVNENGLYAGLSVRPLAVLRIDAYADLFQFPWLKYRVDAPSHGKDFLLQVNYTPNKQVEIYARYKDAAQMINRTAGNLTTAAIEWVSKKDLRLQNSIVVNKQLTLKNRVELLWYKNGGADAAQGFLGYIEAYYNPAFLKWTGNLRLQYFETDGYNARIYAYEADLPYAFSIPSYYDKGFRYYFNLDWEAAKLVNKKKRETSLDIGLRWAQAIYQGKNTIGSGLDEIKGNRRSECKLQLILKR